jgi:hypothetical protein
MTTEEIDFLRNWSSAGGELAAYERAEELLRTAAGKHFTCGEDAEAKLLRSYADTLKKNLVGPAGVRLAGFIEQSRTRG